MYPQGTILRHHLGSVFAVWVSRRDGWERTGTATLIDNRGIFLTAGHSVYFDKGRPIKITQKLRGAVHEFRVKLLSSPDNFWNEDYALLQAEPWKKEERSAYPLRFDNSDGENAEFIGFEEPKDEPVHKSVVYYSEDDSGRYYQELIFAHSSGALLYDQSGRAFSIVIRYTPENIDSLTGLPPERLAEEWNKRTTISVFPLDRTIETLKQNVPASSFINELIQDLQADVDPHKLPRDLSTRATSLDIILLIDDALFGKIHQKWWPQKSAKSAREELLDRIRAAADDLCVARYYARRLEDYSEALEQRAAVAARAPASAAPVTGGNGGSHSLARRPETNRGTPKVQSIAPIDDSVADQQGSIIDELGVATPEAAARLGLRFLEGALAARRPHPSTQSTSPQRAKIRIQLAIALLRRATASPDIQRVQAQGMKNRDYAAVFADLALAEDLGADNGVGSKAAAERAIRTAISLGGSPTAYQLAGHYAAEVGDPGAAAGLYAQAFAMLSPGKSREQSIRKELEEGFAIAAAQAGVPSSTGVAEFNIAMLPSRGTSPWYPLLAELTPVVVQEQQRRARDEEQRKLAEAAERARLAEVEAQRREAEAREADAGTARKRNAEYRVAEARRREAERERERARPAQRGGGGMDEQSRLAALRQAEERKQPDRAISDYDEAIRLNPKDVSAYVNRGDAYRHNGDYDRAISDYDQAISLAPERAIAYFSRGFAYARKGDYDRAIADYDQAIRLDPKNAGAFVQRGDTYRRKGDRDRALSDYNQAMRLDPLRPVGGGSVPLGAGF
jgi:tetratricopeptide (TPR) repeat protein